MTSWLSLKIKLLCQMLDRDPLENAKTPYMLFSERLNKGKSWSNTGGTSKGPRTKKTNMKFRVAGSSLKEVRIDLGVLMHLHFLSSAVSIPSRTRG